MISSIDYLDADVSDLLGKYIKTRKKNNVVLNELKDNINFTTHINYYDKYFATHTSYPSIDVINFGYLRNMREHKKRTINMINKIIDKTGWVQHDPRRPKYNSSVYVWKVKQIEGFHFDKMNKDEEELDIEKHHNNLLVVDKRSGCSFRSYPPHSRHYNIKDLLKNITYQ
jgi:hypothetical protein